MNARILLAIAILAAAGTTGCGSDSSGGVFTPPSPPPLNAGETIPLQTTVRITASATYPLAQGGTSLRTVCRGHVDVIIENVPGSPVTNTCNATQGSSNQTNPVAGLNSVVFQLMRGATADVTLN